MTLRRHSAPPLHVAKPSGRITTSRPFSGTPRPNVVKMPTFPGVLLSYYNSPFITEFSCPKKKSGLFLESILTFSFTVEFRFRIITIFRWASRHNGITRVSWVIDERLEWAWGSEIRLAMHTHPYQMLTLPPGITLAPTIEPTAQDSKKFYIPWRVVDS